MSYWENLRPRTRGLLIRKPKKRLEEYGYNEPPRKKEKSIVLQIFSKFFEPLIIVLIIIGILSLFFGDIPSAIIVFALTIMSVVMGFVQEYRASKEVEKLMEMVKTTTTIYRNGKPKEVNIRDIVPGDIVDLYAGDMIPADLRILSCKDLFINQATLTGESIPVEKTPKTSDKRTTSMADMPNIAFMGSSVVSGTGIGVVVKTGVYTQFGELSRRLSNMQVETSFDKGVRTFTFTMIRVMIVMVIVIFCINWFFKHDILQALMFSLAVAVGLTPEMLPLIIHHNPFKGRHEDVEEKGNSKTPQFHTEFRGNGYSVHGQDRHADHGQGGA